MLASCVAAKNPFHGESWLHACSPYNTVDTLLRTRAKGPHTDTRRALQTTSPEPGVRRAGVKQQQQKQLPSPPPPPPMRGRGKGGERRGGESGGDHSRRHAVLPLTLTASGRFIAAVLTVIIAVTDPLHRDADAVAAGEEASWARAS